VKEDFDFTLHSPIIFIISHLNQKETQMYKSAIITLSMCGALFAANNPSATPVPTNTNEMLLQQRMAMFEEQKAAVIAFQEQRIQNIQKSRDCVASAKDAKTLKACEMEENSAMKQARNEFKQKMESLRAQNKPN
jgi:hypothetical protein